MEHKPIPNALVEKYLQFSNTLVNNLFFVKCLSFLIDQAEYDPFATALVNISVPTQTTLSVIRELVASEFERNFRTPGSILRGNCVASKLMGAFSRKVGANFIKECIGDFVLSICTNPDLSLEIDPQKLAQNNEKAAQNAELLREKSIELLNKITDVETIKLMPNEIKIIAGFTAEYARIYCSDRLLPLAGGFIMLRLFNPSLVTPEAFGIIPEGKKLTPQGRRNLTLITKLLQNLSNGVLFGSKEQYMVCMNSFIEENQPRMNEFLTRLTNSSQEIGNSWKVAPKSLTIEDVQPKDLYLLHQLVFNYKNKLLEQMKIEITKFPEKEFNEEDLFFQTFDELGPAPQSSSRKATIADTSIAFLTPPEKSGTITKRKTSLGLSVAKKYWIVLSGPFLHFFYSPQETVPRKSIALDELWVNVNGDLEGTCFSLTYYRKDHLFYCQTQDEVNDWVNAVVKAKEKYSKSVNKKSARTLRPIEVRIRNQIHGLKIDYEISLINYKSLDNRRIVFVFEVEAFEYKYTFKKFYSDILNLHNSLTHEFPRLIFPVFPRKIGEGQTDMPLGRYNNRTSFAVIIVCKFIRAYLLAIKSNLSVYQSETVLDFTTLSCPVTAVKAGRVDYLSSLFQAKVDLNMHHRESGLTALHSAILLENEEIVKWLVTCSAVHINSKDNEGNTPLMLAIKYGKVKMFHILMDNGADFKIKNNKRTTALHFASKLGDTSVCETLIDKGLKVTELNEMKKSPIYYAITRGHSDVARLLFQRGADPSYIDPKGNNLLHLAVASGEYEIVEFLLKLGLLDVNSHGEHKVTPLHIAAATGNDEIAKLLLAHKADVYSVDCQHESPVFVAVMRGNADVIKVMNDVMQINVTETKNGFSLIHQAVLEHHCHIISTLVSVKCDINSADNRGRTPLILATLMNDVNMVSALLESGASPNVADQRKRTPLYIASYRGYEVICQLLLAKFANPEISDAEGTTPLHVCIWAQQLKIAKYLLIRGANPNHREFIEGNTPLHTAIRCNAITIGILLIQHGADVNAKRQFDGNTPLHLCVEYGCKSLAKALMESPKIKLNIVNKSEQTPLQLAVTKGDDDLINFIKYYFSESRSSSPMRPGATIS